MAEDPKKNSIDSMLRDAAIEKFGLKGVMDEIEKVKPLLEQVAAGAEVLKGKDGKTPELGKDYLNEEEQQAALEMVRPKKGVDYNDGEPGTDGYTPVKGVDYFTDDEVGEITRNATPIKGTHYFTADEVASFKKEITPTKGVDYNDGENPTPAMFIEAVKSLKGKDAAAFSQAVGSKIDISHVRNAGSFIFNGKTYKSEELMHGGGSGSGSSLTLQTNGVANGSQTLLNLAAGTNITLTDNGSGTVTIDASGGGGGTVDSVVGTTNRITVDSTDPANPIVDIAATYVGQSSITTLGTITTGTWSATTIALNKGGTGQTTKAAAFDALSPMTTGGDIIYGGASGTGTRLANGSAGQVLTSSGTTVAPTWTTVTTAGLTVGTSTISSGTTTRILYDNAGVLGEYTLTGSGTVVVMATAPTMSNPVVGTQSTSDNSTKAASTAYVTTAIANAIAGVDPAIAVLVATTSAGDTSGLTYNNGTSGVGATLTGANNTAVTIDGHTFIIGDVGVSRLLVKNDTQSPSGAFNGVYLFTALQTVGTGAIFTRALDYNTPSNINSTGAIPVVSGTTNASTSWLLTSTVTTIGTDALTYTQFTLNPTTVVVGPASATDGVPALFNGTTGKLIKNSTPTGTGNPVMQTSPTLTTPVLGVATATSINGLVITTTTGTLTMTNAKTLAVTNTLTLSGTDSTVMTFPTTTATIARTDAAQTFTGTQTFTQVITTANAITATSNAATIPVTSRHNIVTNNSAATLTLTLTTSGAVNMQTAMVQILDFSAVAQTITWVNTENSTITAPTTSNGSTSLPLTVGFVYNSATSKWRCVASA